jgi:hypothetical protein
VAERGDRHDRLQPLELPPVDRVALCREQHCLPRAARAGQQRAIRGDGAVPREGLVLAAREGREDVGRMAGGDVEMRADGREGDDRALRHAPHDREDVGLDAGEGVGAGHRPKRNASGTGAKPRRARYRR